MNRMRFYKLHYRKLNLMRGLILLVDFLNKKYQQSISNHEKREEEEEKGENSTNNKFPASGIVAIKVPPNFKYFTTLLNIILALVSDSNA